MINRDVGRKTAIFWTILFISCALFSGYADAAVRCISTVQGVVNCSDGRQYIESVPGVVKSNYGVTCITSQSNAVTCYGERESTYDEGAN